MSPATPATSTLFISYSHHDEALKDKLVVHLASLRHEGKIQAWHNRDIEAGAEWSTEIKQHFGSADVILLLITPRFIASDECYDQEMQQAIQRHEEGTARVIPIILKPCDWQYSPFSKLQALPTDGKPITTWNNLDEAFLNVAQGIRKAVESLELGRKPLAPTASPAAQSKIQNPKSKIEKPQSLSNYQPSTWVERTAITEKLLNVLRGNCRILALVGITGIGKTALAERLVVELSNPSNPSGTSDTSVGAHGRAPLPTSQPDIKPFRRLNLDEGGITPDFVSSGAALLRNLGDEPTLDDQKDPQNLLTHILSVLKERPVRLQIDSMERLLQGNDQEGWSEFFDPLWLELFQRLLTTGDCQSQLILTTQDIPENLAYEGSRYDALWHCEPIRGLNEAEQLELFSKRGIGISPAPSDNSVGAHGHAPSTVHQPSPTDLARESVGAHDHISNAEHLAPSTNPALGRQPPGEWPFAPTSDASVSAQQAEILDYLKRIGRIYDGHPLVLRVIAEDIKTCGGNVVRYWQQCHFDDLEAHKPTRFSRRKLQRDVERRVKAALESLPKEALQLLCRASVYRRPVPRSFWLGLMPDLDANQGEALLNLLESRGFATEDWEPGAWLGADDEIPLRQYNLIRNVAYSLLQANKSTWKTAHCQAADLWLTAYEANEDVPNLEKVRGFIEAFEHYIAVDDWGNAEKIFTKPIDNFSHVSLPRQLEFWSYYQEGIKLCELILNKSTRAVDSVCLRLLGNYHLHLANYDQVTSFYQQSLVVAREIGDRSGESKALGNLGIAYYSLGQYQQAIDFHQQALSIAQEIGDRQWEGRTLGNLGNAYYNLGQYQQAMEYHQQYLAIARGIGDRYGEGNALGSLGIAYDSLGQYQQAIDYHQQYLAIAREIGDRQGEAIALGNLGSAYCALKIYPEALDLQHQKLQIAREINSPGRESYALSGIGEVLIKLERFEDALESLQQALDICEQTGERSLHAEVLKNLAELHQKLGEREQALSYCEQALAISTELGIPLKTECESLLAELEQSE